MPDRDLEFWDDDGDAFREILGGWPKAVRLAIGSDIRRIQRGEEPRNWKPLKSFPVVAGEVRHKGGARVVYSVAYAQISGKVFIADAFMKDSSDGSEMRSADRRRIETRLKAYKARYEGRSSRRLH